jgi:hypothetical protein
LRIKIYGRKSKVDRHVIINGAKAYLGKNVFFIPEELTSAASLIKAFSCQHVYN